MTFSIIVPVYNAQRYLISCLDSLVNQSFADYEVILVNDGSTDDSPQILDRYAQQYCGKVVVHHKENGGVSTARNTGISLASGDYLLFVDSDDYLHPDTLATVHKEIEANHPDVIGFHYTPVLDGVPSDVVRNPVFSNLSGDDAIITFVDAGHSFNSIWNFAYRTQYWRQNQYAFIRGIYAEDFALTPVVILRAQSVSCIDFAAYYYVLSEGSVMRTRTPEQLRLLAENLLAAYDHLDALIHAAPAKKPLAQQMFLAYLANNAIYRMDSIDGDLKKWYRKELRKRNVADNLITNSFKRKVRKILFRLKYRI